MGEGGREGLEAILLDELQDGFLTEASPPTYIVHFYLSLRDRPASLLTSGQKCVLLTPGVFPGYFPWLCN